MIQSNYTAYLRGGRTVNVIAHSVGEARFKVRTANPLQEEPVRIIRKGDINGM